MTDEQHIVEEDVVQGPGPETAPAEDTVQGPGPAEAGPGPEEIARERDQYLDALQRLKAEFDNYRKRTAREQSDLSTRAALRLVSDLLPVLDDLERALAAAEEHEEAKLEDGVRLVHRSLVEALQKEGLAEIETDGAFDPHVHEALLAQPSEDKESGAVLDVVQKGYRIGDKVLRPARVIVAE